MRFIFFIFLIFAGLYSFSAMAAQTYQQRYNYCFNAKLKARNLIAQENPRLSRRRQLDEWAVRQCGGLQMYHAVKLPEPRPTLR